MRCSFQYQWFLYLLSVNVKATDRHWAKTLPQTFPMLFISAAMILLVISAKAFNKPFQIWTRWL
jgi:hypothetical protein